MHVWRSFGAQLNVELAIVAVGLAYQVAKQGTLIGRGTLGSRLDIPLYWGGMTKWGYITRGRAAKSRASIWRS
jgi:hypothetical protein